MILDLKQLYCSFFVSFLKMILVSIICIVYTQSYLTNIKVQMK